MKKQTLRIMIASPNDVAKERQSVRDIIKNINYWAVFANIEFVSIDWENNTYPSVADYPQDAINKQIGDKYDILIGIFWTRVGTQTPNFISGSIEEIEYAIDKSKKNKKIDVMLYFKTDNIPSDIFELEQIEKLKAFKSNLSNNGVYYWEFKTNSDFKNYISQHLALLVQHKYWINSKDKELLDFLKEQKTEYCKSPIENFEEAKSFRREIHEIISYLGIFHNEESEQQNIENKQLSVLLRQPKSKGVFNQIKKVMDESTLRIREQALVLGKEIEDIKLLFVKMFNSYSSAILMSSELNKKDKNKLRESVESLVDLRQSYYSIIEQIERSTKLHKLELKDSRFPAYNRALKEYLKTKQIYRDVFIDSIFIMDELDKSVKKII